MNTSAKASLKMDTTIQNVSSPISPITCNLFCTPGVFIFADKVVDSEIDYIYLEENTTIERFKYDFRRFILDVWRQPSSYGFDLPYGGYRKVPLADKMHCVVGLRQFVMDCFRQFQRRQQEKIQDRFLPSGGYVYKSLNRTAAVVKRSVVYHAAVPVLRKKRKTRVSHKPNKKCNRMQAIEMRMNATLAFGLGGPRVHARIPKFPLFQSGGKPVSFVKAKPQTTHAERDKQQAAAVQRKAKLAFKALPKAVREASVKSSRDKRNPVIGDNYEDAGYQVGGVAKIIVSAVTAFAAGSLTMSTLKATRKVNGILEEADKLIKAIKSYTSNPIWMIPVACIACFFIGKPIFQFAYHVLTSVMRRFFPKRLWEQVAPHVAEVTYQDGTNVLGKVMATTCVFSVFNGMKFDSRTMTEFTKRMSMLPRLGESITVFSDWIVSAFESAVNFFRGLFGKEALNLRMRKATQLDTWSRKVEAVLLQYQTVDVVPSPEVIDGWLALVAESHELREIYRGTPPYRGICELYDRLLTVIKPYKGSINARNNFRVEPEMLLLTGAPGIGKTVLTMWLCATILKKARLARGDSKSVLREIWQKGCSEYWNGYAGQKALIVDDAFQMHGDKTDKDNDFINVIRSISSWAFPLNFADVESKGAIYFTSQLVLATTNRVNLEYGREMVYDMGAVYRRINHGYTLKLNPDFALPDGKLDIAKLQEAKMSCPKGTFPWHVWSLVKHDFQTGNDLQIEKSLSELIDEVSEKLIAKNACHLRELEDLAEYVDSIDSVGEVEFQSGNTSRVGLECDVSRVSNEPSSRYSVPEKVGEAVNAFFSKLSGTFLGKGFRAFMKADEKICKELRTLVNSFRFNNFLTECFYAYLLYCVRYFIFVVSFNGSCMVVKAVSSIITACLGCFFGKKEEPKVDVVEQSNAKTPIQKVHAVTLQNGADAVIGNVDNNCYYMSVMNEGETYATKLGFGIFVVDNLFIFPEHFDKALREYPDGVVLFTHKNSDKFTFQLPVGKFLTQKSYSRDEITYMRFDSVRAHRNIIGSFLKDKDLPYCAGKGAVLMAADADMRERDGVVYASLKQVVFESAHVQWNPNGAFFATMKLPRFFRYSAATRPGHCGSPLLSRKPTLFGGRMVMGLHVAGDESCQAYAIPVTCEDIESARKQLQIVDDQFLADLEQRGIKHQVGDTTHLKEMVSMLPICVLDEKVPMAQKTNIYRTQYFGCIGDCDLAPAKQRPFMREGELIYPMANAVAPYNTPINLFEDDFDSLVHTAMMRFSAVSKHAPKHVLDFDTAVKGDPQLEYFRSIPRATAAGFPYSVIYGAGKKSFFGADGDYDLTLPACIELRERVEYIIASARNNIRLSHVFTDFLKDELRSQEKVDAGKTRLISASPLDYTIAFRMYFGTFMASVMRNHIHSGMAPGVCVFTEWDVVLREMTSKGQKICAGDFKAFDSSEQPPLHWAILRFINKWYDDGNDTIRAVLWLELVHSRHLGGPGDDQRFIYQWNHSLPSGHPFTTIVNSMYSLSALVYAVTKTLDVPYWRFWSIATALTYGDDNLLNVSDDIVERLPVSLIAKNMQRLGLVYTSDSKGDVLEDWRDHDRVTFLKRGFLRSDGRVNAPLDLDSFLYTFYFCKNKKLESDIFVDVVENALEELSMHESHVWETYAHRLYALLSERVIPRAPCQRECYLNIIKTRSDNWF